MLVSGADAAAGEDHRALFVPDAIENFLAIGFELRRIVADLILRVLLLRRIIAPKTSGIDGGALYVHRNVEPTWAGTPTLRQMPGALEVITDGERVVDRHCILGDVRDHGNDVCFLISELTQAGDASSAHAGFTLHLPGDDQHRNGVGPSSKNSVEGIDAAGAGGHVNDAGQAADAGVSFSRHR